MLRNETGDGCVDRRLSYRRLMRSGGIGGEIAYRTKESLSAAELPPTANRGRTRPRYHTTS